MIRPLRQRHRRIFTALGVVLPVALVVGIAARKAVPTSASLPGVVPEAPRFAATRWSRVDLFGKTGIHAALVRERADGGQFAVALSAPKDFAKPDLLVYWTESKATILDAIPDDAVLLGGFDSSAPLTLPASAAQSSGMLVLYSLADHEVVDVSKPFSF